MEKHQEIAKLFQERFACKQYDATRKITDTDFQTILMAARLSPSSFGFEPWHFVLLENQEVKEKLHSIAWGAVNSLNGASHLLLVFARKKVRYDSPYIKHIMKDIQKLPIDLIPNRLDTFENFQKEDFNLLESERTLFDWSSKQTYIALGNILTVARMLDIDSCPIEGFDKAKVEDLLAEYKIIDLASFGLSYMVSFGYKAKDYTPREKTRQTLEEIYTIAK